MPRRKHDFYETPPHYLEALEEHICLHNVDTVLEPCVGEGAIEDWLRETFGCAVISNDLDHKRHATYHLDAAEARKLSNMVRDNAVNWVITNPPFSLGFEILTNLYSNLRVNYVFLVRISFNEPTMNPPRGLFLQANPPKMLIFLPRYSFRLNDKGQRQTDNVTCCWMGWGPSVPAGIFYSTIREGGK